MYELIRSRRTVAWLILMAATGVSWKMGHGVGFNDLKYASTAIIFLAMLKIRLVILEFMEFRHAPMLARIASEGWGAAMCVVLTVLYWRGR